MGRLVLFLSLCHCVALGKSQVTLNPTSISTSMVTSTMRTTRLSIPRVQSVSVQSRNETALTLQWDKVNNSSDYKYTLSYDEKNVSISASGEDSVVTYTVSPLSPGTNYTFTLYTVLEGDQSIGYTFSNVTTPSRVGSVSVKSRNETALTLEWNKENNRNDYNYILSYDGGIISISGSGEDSVVTYTVSPLSPGTNYTFTLYTVFEGVESIGYTFSNVTTPSRVGSVSVKSRNETALTLEWNKENNRNDYNYILSYDGGIISISGSGEDSVVTYTVSPLSPGTNYTFTLYTVFEGVESIGYTFSNVTTPSRVGSVSVKSRNETALTLEWNKENNRNDYNYILSYDGGIISISGSGEDSVVTYTVSPLSPGTNYTFTLYTVFEGVESIGYTFSNVTTPSRVGSVSVKSRNETALTLEWNKENNRNDYNYILSYDGGIISISGSGEDSVVTYTVSPLSPGTNYTFTLYTVFEGVESIGYTFSNVTTPSIVDSVSVKNRSETALTLEWNKVNNSNDYNYVLSYDGETISISGSGEDSAVTHTISSLSPGTNYTFTLYTVFEGVESSGYIFTNVTFPAVVSDLHCEFASGGYGLVLVWGPPNGERTSVLVNMNGKSFSESGQRLSIGGLQPAQWYTLTVTAESAGIQSDPASITCQTDPRGVIAGVLVFLLLVILILCIGIFIWRRKSKLIDLRVIAGVLVFLLLVILILCIGIFIWRRKSESSEETNLSNDKHKPIPLKKFPEHFASMSRDENRGFSEEYEDLGPVGTDQSRTAALLPENMSKNRFTNVLAYDSSRVKLNVQNGAESDYINANYMTGYGCNRKQYIAAQGPLASTVNDFWRMVWEQKSQSIVMLTNCTESGRVKCEQYWPLDYTPPCVYGNVLVTIQSEQKEKSWTLREFVIRHKNTSEERTVTHFHFTAWPDHGVPKGTDELIQFCGIVRQHIDSFLFTGPTVVHCSAGVGRTGTLIALDILLQQLEKEEAVNIAACVHRMRLSRPLMVQTESQYVFLHQCIMDSLQPKEDFIQESIYENSDMIYANAMVLQQYKTASPV